MSENILRALMQLFAFGAELGQKSASGRKIVEAFLRQQVSAASVLEYISLFDYYFQIVRGGDSADKISGSVSQQDEKVIRICGEINKELNVRQKHIVLIRLIEFVISTGEEVTQAEKEFLGTVTEVFNVGLEDYSLCFSFVSGENPEALHSKHFLVINGNEKINFPARHISREGFEGEMQIIRIPDADILFAKYLGSETVSLNSQPMTAENIYVLTQGSVLRNHKTDPVYYSEILHQFLEQKQERKITLSAKNLEYRFKNGHLGLHSFTFSVSSGNLVAVMGGSGAGKSTLLNVLNGSEPPSKGHVHINGINLHVEKKKSEGIIGNIPQDDLLIEDLTVYQNLFYNAKLCFGNLDENEIKRRVETTLDSLGLTETKHLRVGNVLNKTISGGQRKRLNIALELIREPSILFVDEPTSGLSSRDAENVMDLLKQLSNSGKLVFVVIHQPSSDVFRMFDKLLLLDNGGYPIFFGNPVDALIYFRKKADLADADEAECERCGNITPEQLFEIIERKALDEFGNETASRKKSPHDWYLSYKYGLDETEEQKTSSEIPASEQKRASVWKQFGIFFIRDVLSKFSNKQYMLINLLEAPLLAVVLAVVLRYHKPGTGYVFMENQNIPAYLFISVIVALFLGLIVSAEEIIRDRRIQKREAFLDLSRNSYLFSKISVMFILSAVQSLMFVLLGNLILGIHGLNMDYFLVMFTTSCFANMLGLNISSGLNSVVTIYIVIPFLIIPQILLSGVIVKFDKLNPVISSSGNVPFIGNIMTSRWAFEALAVNQFTNNLYEKNFFSQDRQMSIASFKKDWWLSALREKSDKAERIITEGGDRKQLAEILPLLKNEIEKENKRTPAVALTETENLTEETFDINVLKEVRNYFEQIRQFNISRFNRASDVKDAIINRLQSQLGKEEFKSLKKNNYNEATEELLRNINSTEKILVAGKNILQKYEPVYMETPENKFLSAPFFVCEKNFFGKTFGTFGVNLMVIWFMTLILYMTLVTDALRKFLSVSFYKRKRK
ncbi:MAG TPA: ATP-binding cassette domain-containing protein [Bacteroidia bacterium]|nr:ATP-binding cassette domain-containing protein [Bacteroidia bacterium]